MSAQTDLHSHTRYGRTDTIQLLLKKIKHLQSADVNADATDATDDVCVIIIMVA